MDGSPIQNKSFAFAVRVVEVYRMLCEQQHEYVLSKQLLRSGTSIGANAREATRGQSRSDFAAKLTIALKEADESLYWIELLKVANILSPEMADSLHSDCEELVRMLTAATKKLYEK